MSCRFQVVGRPGPNSGVNVGNAYVLPSGVFEVLRALFIWIDVLRGTHIEDTRVGSNVGRSLPIAHTICLMHHIMRAKLYDPYVLRTSCQAISPIITRTCQVIACVFNTTCTVHTSYRSLHIRHSIREARRMHTPAQWSQARLCSERSVHVPDAATQALGCLSCILLLLRLIDSMSRRVGRTSWFPRRCTRGVYRRRCSAEGLAAREKVVRAAQMHACCAPPVRPVRPGPYNNPAYRTLRPPQSRYRSGSVPYSMFLIGLLICMPLLTCAAPHPPLHPPNTSGRTRLSAHGQQAVRLTAARKRAFKRAQVRAMRDGSTMYRGARHDTASLALQYVGQNPTPKPPRSALQNNHLQAVTWNCGGLHAQRYAELMQWLNSDSFQSVHLVFLQECHWPNSTEYCSERWIHIYSGTNSSQGGVMIMINKSIAAKEQIRYAELVAGRVLHVRIGSDPPVDALCVYQYAWTNHPRPDPSSLSPNLDPKTELLHKRHHIWSTVRTWANSVPHRNTMLIAGDFNASLQPQSPNIGLGVQGHRAQGHPDQKEFQNLVIAAGLIALNTWGRSGQRAATFLMPKGQGVQIDFLLTRLPCSNVSRKATAWHHASIVHPTGFRHVPLGCSMPFPSKPVRKSEPALSAQKVKEVLLRNPALTDHYQQAAAVSLQRRQGRTIEACLAEAWHQCTKCLKQGRPTSVAPQEFSLRAFWCAKRHLRHCQTLVRHYNAPVIWYVAHSSTTRVRTLLPGSVRRLRPLLQLWRAAISFQKQDRELRQKVKANKLAKVDHLILVAQEADKRGLRTLHQLLKHLKPKAPRRSIHFRRADGQLMSIDEEMDSLRAFFSALYQADTHTPTPHYLQEALQVEPWEVTAALHSMPAHKALPPGQVPARLWKLAARSVEAELVQDFNTALQPGPLCFPHHWHDSYLALLAKPHKAPNCPANLRPINLLVAEAKLLARIAAQRLQPLVQQAMQRYPQFAYAQGRQTSDALDRVISHCCKIRNLLQGKHRSAFQPRSSASVNGLIGGLQVSIDLTKAYDRLPRDVLQRALEHIQTPDSLIALILYIHDNARVCIRRHDQSVEIGMGRGVRQGCGLSPLLWIAFTLLLHDSMSAHIPLSSQTSYADDFHLMWEFSSAQEFKQACTILPKLLACLQSFGMEVSLEKTVALLAIKGPAAAALLKQYTKRVRGARVLRLFQGETEITLPLRREHDYLGVKISYHLFERATVKHRTSLSWVAFNRVHSLLKHQMIPLRKRVLLWQACVWAVMRYGLTATGLDPHSAQQLRSGVMKQLRLVARSPAHVSHETNEQLLRRLGVLDPLRWLGAQCKHRIEVSRNTLAHLQPTRVQHWWSVVEASFCADYPPSAISHLTEVTQILRIQSTCDICGQSFPSHHALKVHKGKQHPESQPKHEPNPTLKNKRVDEYRKHAKGGLPQCRYCLKRFYGWPQFMGHFSQAACPILHRTSRKDPLDPRSESTPTLPDTLSTHTAAASVSESGLAPAHGAPAPGSTDPTDNPLALAHPDPTPLFYREPLQDLARKADVLTLRNQIRLSNLLCHCPECFQKVTRPAYLTRHACQMHSQIAAVQDKVVSWALAKGRLSKPCEWCGDSQYTRTAAHLKACPVLWIVGHFLIREDRAQASLHGAFGRARGRPADPGAGGVCSIRGLHESRAPELNRGSLRSYLHSTQPGRNGGDRGPGQGDGCRSGSSQDPTRRGGTQLPSTEVGEGRQQGGGQDPGDSQRQGWTSPEGHRGAFLQDTGIWIDSADADPKPADGSSGPGGQDGPRPEAGPEPGHPALPAEQELESAARLQIVAHSPWGQGGPQRGDPSHGETLLAAGRPAERVQPRRGVHNVSPNGCIGKQVLRDSQPVRGSSAMASTKRIRSGKLDPTDAQYPSILSFLGASGAPRKARDGPGHDGPSPPDGFGGRGSLPVSPMGCGPGQAHQGPGGAVEPSGGCGVSASAPSVGHVPTRGGALPRAAEAHRSPHGGRDPLYAHGSEQDGGVPPALHPDASSCQKFGLAPHRINDEANEDWAVAISEAAGQNDPEPLDQARLTVTKLRLANPSNHCYANSVILAVAWGHAGSPQSFQPSLPLGRMLRWLVRHAPLPQTDHARNTVDLWALRVWRQIVHTWQAPHSQHDAGEFVQFLASHLHVDHARYEWQAREEAPSGQVIVRDRGCFWPLILSLPLQTDGPSQSAQSSHVAGISVQRLVIQWRNQPARHAACDLPPWLPLQVSRFNAAHEKITTPVRFSPAIYLPVFTGTGLQTTSIRYALHSVIFHIGRSKFSGHYRTALCQSGQLRFLTDDGVEAIQASEYDRRSVEENAYILLFIRC